MNLPVFTPPYAPSTSDDHPEIRFLKGTRFRLKWKLLTPIQADDMSKFFKERGFDKFFLYTPPGYKQQIEVCCEAWRRDWSLSNAVSVVFREKPDLLE